MRRSQHGFSFGCVLAAAAVWPVLPARLADAQVADGRPTGRAARLVPGGTPEFCAAYGTGFVRLQGTDTCVRIGGHVRVDATNGARTQLEFGTGGFAGGPDEGETIGSRVRLNGDFVSPGLR